ncbi:MAG TPA: hypothetical protein VFO67_04630 [Gemmatimonadales bacterium]|nr:hypothetical protein [Gemmatimonadales bacterium]
MSQVLILLGATSFALVSAQEGNRRTVWSGTVGQRQVVVEEQWTPPFTDISVSVRVSAPGKTSTIEISSAGRSPDVVVPWASERLVLITAETASVVDLVSGQVADQFFVARPAISPTGRFIAYRRFQPPSSQDEDVLLLYDVGSSVQLNRLPPNPRGMEFMRDVGLPVFPEWHTANQKYRGRNDTPGAPIETLRSAVVWASDTDFVFLAGRGGPADPEASLAIHHVHVRGGGQHPVLRSQTIDANKVIADAALLYARDIKVLDCAGSVCQAQIEWVPTQGLRAPSLHVTF